MDSPRQAAFQRISEQEAHVERQRAVIARLKANGTPTVGAERSLATMEDILEALRQSLRWYPLKTRLLRRSIPEAAQRLRSGHKS
jgi:hypothetical protein